MFRVGMGYLSKIMGVCFVVFFVLLLCIFSNNSTSAADNLVGYWKFDAGTGSSLIDSSGENVSGSFTATQPTWSTDVPSTQFNNPYSLDFTGTGDAVTIAWPSSLNFNATAARSFSFWYKPTGDGETASGNYDRIISWSDDKFEIAGTYGDVSVHRLAFYDGSWRDTGFNMSVGTWYNITFTYDGTNVKLYVNNVEKFSGTSEGRALSGTMYIGTRYTGDEGINGRIDDVRVYDRALTLSEIQNISEGGSGPGVPTSTPTPTPTPSPTISSNSQTTLSSSSSSNSSSSSCTSQSPYSAPDLFQVSTSLTTATLYFTPVHPATGYTISYGTNDYTNEHSISFDYTDGGGAASYTINELSKGTKYYFRIQGKNNCAPGNWSKIIEQTTTKETSSSVSASRGNLEVVRKEQVVSPKENQDEEQEETIDEGPTGYDLSIKVIHDNKPVEGAHVEIHSVPRKTITDKNGIARFSNIEKGEHTVFLSYQGYEGEEKLTVDGNQKDVEVSFTIELKPSNTFFSPMAIGVIGFLVVVIIALFFTLWKRKKKSKK